MTGKNARGAVYVSPAVPWTCSGWIRQLKKRLSSIPGIALPAGAASRSAPWVALMFPPSAAGANWFRLIR
jgi:hypothetical protein